MSKAQDKRNGTRKSTPAAVMFFALIVGMGYTISAPVEGAVDTPLSAEEQFTGESSYLESTCVSHGLVLSDCGPDF